MFGSKCLDKRCRALPASVLGSARIGIVLKIKKSNHHHLQVAQFTQNRFPGFHRVEQLKFWIPSQLLIPELV